MSWKGTFQCLHESQRKTYVRAFRVLGKVLYKIKAFQGPIESFEGFQGFQGQLDTLIIYICLYEFLESKNLIFDLPFGIQQKYSTSHVLIHVTDEIR